MMKIMRKVAVLSVITALASCANQPKQIPASPSIQAAPATSAAPPDIFPILVDGHMYNHMDDARRAMDEQEAKLLDRISTADTPRFGTLLIIAPPVHVPELNIPNPIPAYREKFNSFMTFLDAHNYETDVAAVRKSNNFANVILKRSAAIESWQESEAEFEIWYQKEGAKISWWIKGRNKGEVRLATNLEQGSLENVIALVANVSAYAEK